MMFKQEKTIMSKIFNAHILIIHSINTLNIMIYSELVFYDKIHLFTLV
jgi:hypothetical protein